MAENELANESLRPLLDDVDRWDRELSNTMGDIVLVHDAEMKDRYLNTHTRQARDHISRARVQLSLLKGHIRRRKAPPESSNG